VRIPPSDAQLDALAVAKGRSSPYEAENAQSIAAAWDVSRRQPRDLREAAHYIRRAYADEVPARLHERELAPDGTPRMTAKAVGYIFGAATYTARPDNEGSVSFYATPFRATLASIEAGDAKAQDVAAIVRHVAIGGDSPVEAAIKVGIPYAWAAVVAEIALRTFLRMLSSLHIEPGRVRSTA
jgi:hypothetical protein